MKASELTKLLQREPAAIVAASDVLAALENAYREGYEDGVRNYATWRNGEQFVGALNRPLKGVLAEDSQKPIPVRY